MWPGRRREDGGGMSLGWGQESEVPQWGDTADIPGGGTHGCKSSEEGRTGSFSGLCVLPHEQSCHNKGPQMRRFKLQESFPGGSDGKESARNAGDLG